MKTKLIYLTEPQIKRLERTANVTGLSMSEIVRRALDEYLENKEQGE